MKIIVAINHILIQLVLFETNNILPNLKCVYSSIERIM